MDTAVRLLSRAFTESRRPSLSVGLLGEARMQAAAEALALHRPEALALCARADAGELEAGEAFGRLAERALADMRARVLERARASGLVESLAARAHARWNDTDEPELLDDPDLDREMRVRILEHLDQTNTLIGIYASFFRAMEPLFDGPTRVLDLAAGHGGFAIAATKIAGLKGLDVHVTASDLKPEYLEIGRSLAHRERVDVGFAVQDALDLSGLAPGAYDVIVCTQSLHHFPASMVARMFREAARAAGRGVVFVDGCRSMAHAVAIAGLGVLRFNDRAFAHDAWVSFRRFFAPEELGLLARLGPEGDRTLAKWMRPAHCLVRLDKRAARGSAQNAA